MSELTAYHVHNLGFLALGELKDHSPLAVIGHVIKNWFEFREWEMESDFKELKRLQSARLMVVYEDHDGYDGAGIYLLWHYGTLLYVEGSHCSCSGFEGQWRTEETSLEALAMKRFYMVNDNNRDALKAYLQKAIALAEGDPK